MFLPMYLSSGVMCVAWSPCVPAQYGSAYLVIYLGSGPPFSYLAPHIASELARDQTLPLARLARCFCPKHEWVSYILKVSYILGGFGGFIRVHPARRVFVNFCSAICPGQLQFSAASRIFASIPSVLHQMHPNFTLLLRNWCVTILRPPVSAIR